MDILKEIESLNPESFTLAVKSFDNDTQKRISAILNILEIGNTSVAGAKTILHTCELVIERCTPINMPKE